MMQQLTKLRHRSEARYCSFCGRRRGREVAWTRQNGLNAVTVLTALRLSTFEMLVVQVLTVLPRGGAT